MVRPGRSAGLLAVVTALLLTGCASDPETPAPDAPTQPEVATQPDAPTQPEASTQPVAPTQPEASTQVPDASTQPTAPAQPDVPAAQASSGHLIGESVLGVHQLALPEGEWVEVLGAADFDAGHVATLHPQQDLLHTAELLTGAYPLTVRSYDLGSLAPVSEYHWPGTDLANRVRTLAVSPDGDHFAAVIADGPSEYLEIINQHTDEVLFSGRERADRTLGMVGEDLLWTEDLGLVFVVDLEGQSPDLSGAVVGVAPEDLGQDLGQVDMSLLVGFDAESWEGGRPEHLAVSGDETQLAFVYVPEGTGTNPAITADVWLADLTDTSAAPRQLTAGPVSIVGPAFSPDGHELAVVEFAARGSRNTYVIDAGASAPTEFRSRADTDARLLATDTRVDTMLGWLP